MIKKIKHIITQNLLHNQNTNQTIFKNTFWLLFAEFLQKSLMLFLTILLARILGVEDYGQLAFALSFATLFTITANFGLSSLTIREVARDNTLAQKYINNISMIKILLSIITLILIFITLQFLEKDNNLNFLVYLFGIYIIINNFTEFFNSIFRAFEKMEYEAYSKILKIIVLFCFGLLFLYLEYSSLYIALSYVLASLVGFICSFIILKNTTGKINLDIDFKLWKKIFKNSWPFALSIAFATIYFSIDSVMIGIILDNQKLGYYTVAYSLITGFYFLPIILSHVYFPKLSQSFKNKNHNTKEYIKGFNSRLIIIGIPLTLILFIFSKQIINILYGPAYSNSLIIFQILICALILKFFTFPYGLILSALNQEKKKVLIQFITIIFNIILNIILIFKLEIIGVAISTVLSELLLLILYYIYGTKIMNKK